MEKAATASVLALLELRFLLRRQNVVRAKPITEAQRSSFLFLLKIRASLALEALPKFIFENHDN